MAESSKSKWKNAFKKFYDDFKRAEEGSDREESTSVDTYLPIEKNVNVVSHESSAKEYNHSSYQNSKKAPHNRLNCHSKIQIKEVPLKNNVDSLVVKKKDASSCTGYTGNGLHYNSPANLEFLRIHGFNRNASKQNKKKQKYKQIDKPVQVPEWNKVFKQILGSDSSAKKTTVEQDACHALKEEENCQKQYVSVKSKAEDSWKNQSNRDHIHEEINERRYDDSARPLFKPFKFSTKIFEDEEEDDAENEEEDEDDPGMKEAKAFFARARLFKRPPVYHMNDFEGMGVDIFKDNKPLSYWAKAIPPEDLLEDNHPERFPLKGFVAPYRPYTLEDARASFVPFDEEPWDNDFFF